MVQRQPEGRLVNRVSVSLSCDEAGCHEEFTTESTSLTVTRRAAREQGWTYTGIGARGSSARFLDLCGKHGRRRL